MHSGAPAAGAGYKLVALDLDGTLLDSRTRLSAANAAAIAACRTAGVRVTLASGKLLGSMHSVCTALGLVEPQIAANGAVVMRADTQEILFMTPLPVTEYRAVMAALPAYHLPAAGYTPFAIYLAQRDPRLDMLMAILEPPPRVLPDLAGRESVDGVPFVKILTVLAQDDPAAPAIEAELRARFEPSLTVVRTSRTLLEFVAAGVDKGRALRQVADLYGLALHQVLAIGDSYNDLPMLAAAGCGVAMANAPLDVQALADAVTLDNDRDGVAAALYRYVLSALPPAAVG